jgi:beta-barrel assembly-enhancing protease
MTLQKIMKGLSFLLVVVLFLTQTNPNVYAFGFKKPAALGGGDKSNSKGLGGGLGGNKAQMGMKVAKIIKKIAEGGDVGEVQAYFLGYQATSRLIGGKILTADHPVTQYIRKISLHLASNSNHQAPYKGYTFIILDNADDPKGSMNAMALPGGFIILTAKFLKFMENEDELACILAHEIAHVEEDHGTTSKKGQDIGKLANLLVEIAGDETIKEQPQIKALLKKLLETASNKMIEKVKTGYNIKQEGGADFRGMEIAYASGYNPKVLPALLERIKANKGSYGGANYSKTRAEDNQKKITSMKVGSDVEVNEARTKRFLKMIEKL